MIKILLLHFRESNGPFKLKYNPKWLCILKQRVEDGDIHTPTIEEEKNIRKIFKYDFEIPENFKTAPEAQINHQTDRLIENLQKTTEKPKAFGERAPGTKITLEKPGIWAQIGFSRFGRKRKEGFGDFQPEAKKPRYY